MLSCLIKGMHFLLKLLGCHIVIVTCLPEFFIPLLVQKFCVLLEHQLRVILFLSLLKNSFIGWLDKEQIKIELLLPWSKHMVGMIFSNNSSVLHPCLPIKLLNKLLIILFIFFCFYIFLLKTYCTYIIIHWLDYNINLFWSY